MKSIKQWTKKSWMLTIMFVSLSTLLGVGLLGGCAYMSVTMVNSDKTIQNIGVGFANYGYAWSVDYATKQDLRQTYSYDLWLKHYTNYIIEQKNVAETNPGVNHASIVSYNDFLTTSQLAYELMITGSVFTSVLGTAGISLGVWWTLDNKKIFTGSKKSSKTLNN